MGTRAITFYFDKSKGLSNVAVNKRFNKADSRMKSATFAKILRWVEGEFEKNVSSLIRRVERNEKLPPIVEMGDTATPSTAKRSVGRPLGYSPKTKSIKEPDMAAAPIKRSVGRPKGYSPKTGYTMGKVKDSTIVKRGVGRPKGYSPKTGMIMPPAEVVPATMKRSVGRPKGYSPKTGYAMGKLKDSTIVKHRVKRNVSGINPAAIMNEINQGMTAIADKLVQTVKNGMTPSQAAIPATAESAGASA